MQLPRLSPLQSRLLAFAITTCLVFVLWICFQPNYSAYAAEIPVPPDVAQHSQFEASIPHTPPDEPPIEIRDGLEEEDGEEDRDALYAPLFAYFDRNLVGRQADKLPDELPDELNNNQMELVRIAPNDTKLFRFKKSQLVQRSVLEDVSIAQTLEEAANGSSDTDGDAEEKTQGDVVKRQAQSRLWISANTCRQPTPTVNTLITGSVPQLTIWVWTSTGSAAAIPSSSSKPVANSTFEGGHANYTLATDQDVYIAVTAPKLPPGWTGSWNFEIAASVDEGYYHNYDNTTNFIYMVDTDSDSTLFITHSMTDLNTTDEVSNWIDVHKGDTMPFQIYAFPDDVWSPMTGLERSYCGLKEQFENSNNLSVATTITTQFGQGVEGVPQAKGMFNVQGLKTSMQYTGFLVLNGTSNMTIDGTATRGGGRVFKSFQWRTKAGMSSFPFPFRPLTNQSLPDDTCQVIFGLSECSTVAYAVPSSPQWKNNDTGLISFYDNLAASYMKNFRRSLAQVACDTAGTAQYSLARTCADCEADYKAWLCSVLIPRCEDWSANAPFLHPRNVNTPFANGSLPDSSAFPFFPPASFDAPDSDSDARENATTGYNATLRTRTAYNQSRNTAIDAVVKPGPYKELLPCEDLCFDIVRSCPAQLRFACPAPPMRALSYGVRDPTGRNLTCNFPGAVVDLTVDKGAAARLGRSVGLVVLVGAVAAVVGGGLGL
jgi:calcium channel MID1